MDSSRAGGRRDPRLGKPELLDRSETGYELAADGGGLVAVPHHSDIVQCGRPRRSGGQGRGAHKRRTYDRGKDVSRKIPRKSQGSSPLLWRSRTY